MAASETRTVSAGATVLCVDDDPAVGKVLSALLGQAGVKAVLASSGIVSTQEEAQGVSRVLGAAAMTYVAGALTAIMTLVYLLMRRR